MTQPIQFRDQAGNDLGWSIIGWDAIIQPKPHTTQDMTAAAEEAEPPASVRRGEEPGSYKRGRLVFQGIPVVIENPKGSVRRGFGPDGRPWANTLQAHYGFIARTFGMDGDGVDVFVGDHPESDFVLVIHQIDPATGQPDEDKVCIGFKTALEAKTAYLGSYQKGWKGMGSVTPTTVQGLKDWIAEGQTERPIRKSEPEADGSRWITVHHGGEGGKPTLLTLFLSRRGWAASSALTEQAPFKFGEAIATAQSQTRIKQIKGRQEGFIGPVWFDPVRFEDIAKDLLPVASRKGRMHRSGRAFGYISAPIRRQLIEALIECRWTPRKNKKVKVRFNRVTSGAGEFERSHEPDQG